MKIIADTNIFIAVALDEPEKDRIIRLTEGHDLVAPEVLPFEIGNALTAMMKKNTLKKEEVASAWDIIQEIPVDLRQTDIKSALNIATHLYICLRCLFFRMCQYSPKSVIYTGPRDEKSR